MSPRPSAKRPGSLRDHLDKRDITDLITAYREGVTAAASLAAAHGLSLLVALVWAGARLEGSQLVGRSTPRRAGGMSVIVLRAATVAEREFCFHLHKAAMIEYIHAIWGWDEQVQRDYHARGFAPGR